MAVLITVAASSTPPLAFPRSFRLGRQEDAHEYLVALLDAIHECSIAGMNPKPAPELAHTSFVYRIFAGRIRSQVGGGAPSLCFCALCWQVLLAGWHRRLGRLSSESVGAVPVLAMLAPTATPTGSVGFIAL